MIFPQLTLPLIAGMCSEEHEVSICEEVVGESIDFDGDYDVIGITLMTQTSIRGYEIANEFRKRDKIVIFGGIHASVLPEEAIKFGDAVCIGELDTTLWERILNDIRYRKLQSFYRLDHQPDLRFQPKPRRDLIQCKTGKFTIAPIETSRGCPYNCDFCSVSRFFGTKQRHRPVRSIIEEAEACDEKVLLFVDDNITFHKKYAKELFRELAALKKMWIGQASINVTKDPELMELAYKSGCRALLVGFESFTDDANLQYRKTLKTIDANAEAVKRLRDNGIMTWASVIFGLDTDTEAIFDLSREFIAKSKVAFFQPTLLTPYPGTELYDRLRNENRILTDNWSKFDTWNLIIEPKNMSPEKLQEHFNIFRKEMFNRRGILRRALPNVRMGYYEALAYYTVNRGLNTQQKRASALPVQRNIPEHPVDFNVMKYVQPLVEEMVY